MTQKHWLKQHQWWLGGLTLTCISLTVILIIWAVQAHQYQLALAHYNATYQHIISLPSPHGPLPGPNPTPYHPPVDTSTPVAWGWGGWLIRLFALLAPALTGVALYWRQQRQHYIRIHRAQLDHATNKLAEAIGANQELPTGVFDAYSKLRELEPPAPHTRPPLSLRRRDQRTKRS